MTTTTVVSRPESVVLRLAGPDDAGALAWLAIIDEEPELTGETLIALMGGEAVAALSLADGRVVSNPFLATCDAIALLRLRAQHVRVRSARRAGRRWRERFTHIGRAHAPRLAG